MGSPYVPIKGPAGHPARIQIGQEGGDKPLPAGLCAKSAGQQQSERRPVGWKAKIGVRSRATFAFRNGAYASPVRVAHGMPDPSACLDACISLAPLPASRIECATDHKHPQVLPTHSVRHPSQVADSKPAFRGRPELRVGTHTTQGVQLGRLERQSEITPLDLEKWQRSYSRHPLLFYRGCDHAPFCRVSSY